LGHAARCVPVIKELQRLGHQVIIGADQQPLAFLQQEFPELPVIKISGYNVLYSKKANGFKLLFEGIRFYQFIKKEHKLLAQILAENDIDVVISDNRYGLWNKDVKSIFITHQVFVKTPLFSTWIQNKIKQLITNFDECWIPDVEGENNLSGDLAHFKKIDFSHQYIGALSRFKNVPNTTSKYDVLTIVSGPEPQRTIFQNLLIKQLKTTQLKVALVAGNPHLIEKKEEGNVTIFSHLPTPQLQELITQSKVVICRAGYSSIMDLVALQQKAVLVPTPGQTEQEYLANYHMEKGNFYSQNQDQFNLEEALLKLEEYPPSSKMTDSLNFDFLNIEG